MKAPFRQIYRHSIGIEVLLDDFTKGVEFEAGYFFGSIFSHGGDWGSPASAYRA